MPKTDTQAQQEIAIQQGEFLDPKKGISLPVISFGVWLSTSILFKLIAVFTKVNYTTFSLFISLLLSIVAGYVISTMLYKRTNKKSFAIAVVLNILLIYAAANGVQASYAANADPVEDKNKVQAAGFVIPFIDNRPWLPDASSKAEIQRLTALNEKLSQKLADTATGYDPLTDTVVNKNTLIRQLERTTIEVTLSPKPTAGDSRYKALYQKGDDYFIRISGDFFDLASIMKVTYIIPGDEGTDRVFSVTDPANGFMANLKSPGTIHVEQIRIIVYFKGGQVTVY